MRKTLTDDDQEMYAFQMYHRQAHNIPSDTESIPLDPLLTICLGSPTLVPHESLVNNK